MNSHHPLALAGERIGLLGGSFNPAHSGHVHISRIALKRLGLDRIWWLVSPQNPLKPQAGMAPLSDRVKKARKVARDPHILVTDIEAELQTRFTYDTVKALQKLYPHVTFVWLMGGDNLQTFHRWQHWQHLARRIAIAVIARPGYARALASPFVRRFAFARKRPIDQPPSWRYILSKLDSTSATQLRASGRWRPEGKL